MHQPKSTLPNEFNSLQVVARFVLRLLLVSTFATFGTRGFGTTFGTMLELLAVLCAVVGALRREALFGPVLTHWDEAATFAVIGLLVSALS